MLKSEEQYVPSKKPVQSVFEPRHLSLGHKEVVTLICESEEPVLVGFNATWCQLCGVMENVLDMLATEFDNVKVVNTMITEDDALVKRLGIKSVPMVKLFSDGEEVYSGCGFLCVDDCVAGVKKALSELDVE